MRETGNFFDRLVKQREATPLPEMPHLPLRLKSESALDFHERTEHTTRCENVSSHVNKKNQKKHTRRSMHSSALVNFTARLSEPELTPALVQRISRAPNACKTKTKHQTGLPIECRSWEILVHLTQTSSSETHTHTLHRRVVAIALTWLIAMHRRPHGSDTPTNTTSSKTKRDKRWR